MKWIANVKSLCLLWQQLRTHFVTKVILFHIFNGKCHTNRICSFSYFMFNSCEQFLISLGAGTYTHTDFVNKSIFKKLEVCWLSNSNTWYCLRIQQLKVQPASRVDCVCIFTCSPHDEYLCILSMVCTCVTIMCICFLLHCIAMYVYILGFTGSAFIK